jgi:hypothetical protein
MSAEIFSVFSITTSARGTSAAPLAAGLPLSARRNWYSKDGFRPGTAGFSLEEIATATLPLLSAKALAADITSDLMESMATQMPPPLVLEAM